jgi:hypothetical protein
MRTRSLAAKPVDDPTLRVVAPTEPDAEVVGALGKLENPAGAV